MAATKKTNFSARSTSAKSPLSDAAFEQKYMIGSKINFAASEAYKLLRTNLSFSFTDEEKCRIIGTTSSLRGEGKSLTSINLAYTLAQSSKDVILIDADMRIPSIPKRLRLPQAPGLSNFLVGAKELSKVIQRYQPQGEEIGFDVITAGDTPPNPSELLGSNRMKKMLEALSEVYSYIVVDLPPITAVADALVVSKLTNGIVLVVRQDYCQRGALDETVRQLKFVEAKVLGVVMNCAKKSGRGYKKYYKKYYKADYKA